MAKASTEATKLVIVESPTKARTIKKFLGPEYRVESCMGHVRDLPQSAKDIPEAIKKEPWSRLGVNVDQDFDPIYCIPRTKTKVVRELKSLLKNADELILATDEDREGESISWHLMEVLKPKVPVKRMVFHEITKKAIQQALEDFREIDINLVRAQEARRILDRLVGYSLSPLLWKKVAYGLSAGRVQSVAVRLIAEREEQRREFDKSNFWGVYAKNLASKKAFESRLLSFESKRVAVSRDFDSITGKQLKDDILVLDAKKAESIKAHAEKAKWVVTEVEEKPISRKPASPFITSTLQQEANRKLGLGAKEAMQVAQKLYEQGHITYMRTDSTFLSEQALTAARDKIKELYGKEYLPDEIRSYQGKKVKGAQEAHEAIRPAGTDMLAPNETKLKGVQRSLYELIWKRTVACQMANAQLKQLSMKLTAGDAIFAASGQTVEFPGFLKVYVESTDDDKDEEKEVHLPKLTKGDVIECDNIASKEHETKPPYRFTEASLVQKMEKEGIGRPSTYASIIGTIIDRGYVNKNGNALVPSFTAMIVAKLLLNHLPKYVDLTFTSEMERSLDDIAAGELDHLSYLHSIYFGDEGLKEQVLAQEEAIDPEEARSIQMNGLDEFSFRVGRYGAYVCRTKEGEEQCASIPDNQPPADITPDDANKLIDQKINGHDALGTHPETNKPIYALSGRYGPYVQLGDAADEASPKRTSLPPNVQLEDVDLEFALFLLSLPLDLGQHPTLEKVVKLGIGRFGPYVVCDGDFRSIPKDKPLKEVNMDFALELMAKPKRGRGRAAALKEFGNHPETEDPIQVFDGKYGPYIKCGKTNVSLPDDLEVEQVTKEKALELLADKIKKKTKKKATKKTKTVKKAATKTTKKAGKTAKKVTKKKVVIRRTSSTAP